MDDSLRESGNSHPHIPDAGAHGRHRYQAFVRNHGQSQFFLNIFGLASSALQFNPLVSDIRKFNTVNSVFLNYGECMHKGTTTPTSLSKKEIIQIAGKVVNSTLEGNTEAAFYTLKPILDVKCPFSKLDALGRKIGQADTTEPEKFFELFDRIIDCNAMGGYVIVGRALIHFLQDNFEKVMEKSREYIIKGDAWYVCDIIGERSLGQSLVDYFERTLFWMEKFLKDSNNWVKRSVGVAIHFFSKRVLDEPEKTQMLLDLVEPYIEEKQLDVVKGIGWGLKTIGRHHPDLLVTFLKEQIESQKNISKLMMRKAMTYLEEDKKKDVHRVLLSHGN